MISEENNYEISTEWLANHICLNDPHQKSVRLLLAELVQLENSWTSLDLSQYCNSTLKTTVNSQYDRRERNVMEPHSTDKVSLIGWNQSKDFCWSEG